MYDIHMTKNEREAILEVLEDQTKKILDAERLGRLSTFRRLMDDRHAMIMHGLKAGLSAHTMRTWIDYWER